MTNCDRFTLSSQKLYTMQETDCFALTQNYLGDLKTSDSLKMLQQINTLS